MRHPPFPFLRVCFGPSLRPPPSSAADDKTQDGLPVLSFDRLLDAVLRSLCIVVCLRGSLLFVLGNTAELCSQRGGPSGLVIVTPGPGPEECQHLRWATGGLRGSPARTCWKALRAGLSRPSSLRYRWAVSVLSGRDPVAQDWVPFQVVPPGLVGKLCVPGSQDHLVYTTAGRSVS